MRLKKPRQGLHDAHHRVCPLGGHQAWLGLVCVTPRSVIIHCDACPVLISNMRCHSLVLSPDIKYRLMPHGRTNDPALSIPRPPPKATRSRLAFYAHCFCLDNDLSVAYPRRRHDAIFRLILASVLASVLTGTEGERKASMSCKIILIIATIAVCLLILLVLISAYSMQALHPITTRPHGFEESLGYYLPLKVSLSDWNW